MSVCNAMPRQEINRLQLAFVPYKKLHSWSHFPPLQALAVMSSLMANISPINLVCCRPPILLFHIIWRNFWIRIRLTLRFLQLDWEHFVMGLMSLLLGQRRISLQIPFCLKIINRPFFFRKYHLTSLTSRLFSLFLKRIKEHVARFFPFFLFIPALQFWKA